VSVFPIGDVFDGERVRRGALIQNYEWSDETFGGNLAYCPQAGRD
jgi:hypothetical protein